MSKRLLLFLLIVGMTGAALAQKGNNQIKVLGEIGIPLQEYNPGLGGYVKFLYGVGRSGQVGLTTGFSKFRERTYLFGSGDSDPDKVYTIPVLLGYRHNMKRFYLEPQAGYGALNGKKDIGGDWARPSVGAFYWSLGAGYAHKRLDVGLRFQNAHVGEAGSSIVWPDKSFYYLGVHVGYTLWNPHP